MYCKLVLVFLFAYWATCEASYFTHWGAWQPNSTAWSRERTRDCLPTSSQEQCTQKHYKEEFIDCSSLCIPNPSTQSSAGCVGNCNNASNVVAFDCGVEPNCKYAITYQCFEISSCAAAWGPWSNVTSCSRICDGGSFVRTRECVDGGGSPSTSCPGSGGETSQNQTILCNNDPCPILTEWMEMGGCSVTCGGGTQNRTRSCIDNNGATTGCAGNLTEQLSCLTHDCPTPSPWVNSSCSSPCGEGNLTRSRNCSYQGQPSNLCVEPLFELLGVCNNTGMCGVWSEWVNGSCSVTCGGGSLTRSRQCILNETLSATCEDGSGESTQNESLVCGNTTCPYLTNYTNVGECSEVCGGGKQNFTRDCMLNGVISTGCDGNLTKQEDCNTQNCTFTSWFEDIPCNVSCGGGIKVERRNCSVENCTKFETRDVDCNTQDCGCPEWTNTTSCSQPCDDGIVTQERECVQPNGTLPVEQRNVTCNIQNCVFTSWFEDIPCNVSCGGGIKVEKRNCSVENCTKFETRDVDCNTQDCGCPEWTNTTSCSQPCDGGLMTQERECVQPNGTLPVEQRNVTCNVQNCTFTSWFEDIPCNVSCGGGIRVERRNCSVENCIKFETRDVYCTAPKDCGCPPWTNTTSCSQPCDGGLMTQERECVQPNGTLPIETRMIPCNPQNCTYGNWSDSSACSVTCNGGTRLQSQTCSVVGCNKVRNRTVVCNTETCIAVGGGNFTLLVIVASIVGALLLAALLYVLVPLCCAPCVAGATLHVDTVTAFAIESIQVASLGVIAWHGKTILHHKPLNSFPGCCKSIQADEDSGAGLPAAVIPPDVAPESNVANVSTNNVTARDSIELNERTSTVELNQWIVEMMAKKQEETGTFSENVTNNNCRSTNQRPSPWVHSGSRSGDRPLSAIVTIARRFSTTDYNKMK